MHRDKDVIRRGWLYEIVATTRPATSIEHFQDNRNLAVRFFSEFHRIAPQKLDNRLNTEP